MFMLRENAEIPGLRFLELSGRPTDEELETYFDTERERWAGKREPEVSILRLVDMWTATQRKSMKDFEDEMLGKMPFTPLGLVIVMPNRIARGAVTAYYWIATPAYPIKLVAHAKDAYDWAVERLQSAGRDVPTRDAFDAVANAEWPARVARPGVGFVPYDAPLQSAGG